MESKFDYSNKSILNALYSETDVTNDVMTEEEFYALPLNDLYIERQKQKVIEANKTPEEKAEDLKQYKLKRDKYFEGKKPFNIKPRTEEERANDQKEYEKEYYIKSPEEREAYANKTPEEREEEEYEKECILKRNERLELAEKKCMEELAFARANPDYESESDDDDDEIKNI